MAAFPDVPGPRVTILECDVVSVRKRVRTGRRETRARLESTWRRVVMVQRPSLAIAQTKGLPVTTMGGTIYRAAWLMSDNNRDAVSATDEGRVPVYFT